MITENRAHSSSLFSDALDFCLWGWRKSEVYRMKVHTRDILDAAALIKKKHEQHANFAHYLQSALRLTVGFSNLYCEM